MTDPEFPSVSGRPDPPFVADETTMLGAWLDFHRTTLLWKCSELSHEQLATRSVPPSSMSLLGLVRHMTEVERSWYVRCFAGRDNPPLYYSDADPDGDFDSLDSASVEDVFAEFHRAVDESRAIAVGVDPDATSNRASARASRVDAVDTDPHDRGIRAPQRPCRFPARMPRRGNR